MKYRCPISIQVRVYRNDFLLCPSGSPLVGNLFHPRGAKGKITVENIIYYQQKPLRILQSVKQQLVAEDFFQEEKDR